MKSRVGLALMLATLLTIQPHAADAAPIELGGTNWQDPSNWSDEALAAQSIFICSNANNLLGIKKSVARGLGGVALVGNGASQKLKSQIKALKKFALHNIDPIIASDEEGGAVQRLRSAIYPLPTARTMGGWSDKKVENTAYKYGLAMKNLGVDIAFSPVADLSIPGFFIDRNSRSFGKKPKIVSAKALAWANGLKSANVLPVIKHWPGHGRAIDTHAKPGLLPSLPKLQTSDLIPFDFAFANGIRAVMVGHLVSKGLTETKTPASRSPKALQILREQIGEDALIFTDSLSMGGATSGLHKNISEAAIKSLAAGVDVALICTPPKSLIGAVTKAIADNRLSREAMIAKAKRILLWKSRLAAKR